MNKRVKAENHPLTLKLQATISANVALAREIVSFPHDHFKHSLLKRHLAATAHVQSLLTMLCAAEGITEKDILKAITIGEDLVDDAVKMAQSRRRHAAGSVVKARPTSSETAYPAQDGEAGPLDLGRLRVVPQPE